MNNERGSSGIVLSVVRSSPFKTCCGVAVETTKGARLIHSDVFALDAAAVFSLTAIFLGYQIQSEHLRDELIIYALAGEYAVLPQIALIGATPDLDFVLSGCFCKGAHERGKVSFVHCQKRDPSLLELLDAP